MPAELRRLSEEARESGEAFRTVRSGPQYRIGVGARRPGGFFVEVIVSVFPGGEVSVEHLERCVVLLSALERRGYRLCCGGDQAVSAELEVEMEKVEREAAAVGASARAAMG